MNDRHPEQPIRAPLEFWFARTANTIIPASVYHRRQTDQETEAATPVHVINVNVDLNPDNIIRITRYDENGNERVVFEK